MAREVKGPGAAPLPTHRQATPLARALAATGDRWTLLIILALSDGGARLNTLRNRLPGVSSAVLDHHVRQMVSHGLLSRTRFREMPPRVELALTDAGAALLPIASALARWGMTHRWIDGGDGDGYVDPEAVLRQLPALLDGGKLSGKGVVETIVDNGTHPVQYRFKIVDGHLEPVAGPLPDSLKPAVSIAGNVAAWEAALGPRRDYAQLHLSGQRKLAEQVFAALPA